MKIAYCDDLHLEFDQITLKNTEKADVLVLAGDICLVSQLGSYPDDPDEFLYGRNGRIHDFFINCSKEFKHIIYVLGNHEHYRYNIKDSLNDLKKHLGYIKNLHILERESVIIDGVTFLGATLWTDMNSGHDETIERVSYAMNDFRIIYNSDSNDITRENRLSTAFDSWDPTDARARWTPLDAVVQFNATVAWIDMVRESTTIDKLVVVTHHAPSFKSIHPSYVHDVLLNGAYASDLEQFIIDRPDILVWFSGHIHHKNQYYIGNTLITSNPRGYAGREDIADNFKLEYLDLNNLPSKN
jgi:Icc-related predicted phosphoesterase